jgi:pimeloyl-ACP methyl ester carboxylesterase
MDFSTPLDGKEDRVSRPDGTELRTVVVGDGERDVVLAHGYGFSLDSWNLVVPLLVSSGHRVITFDQRGHAGSTIGSDGIGSTQMASDYSAVLEHHDVRNGVLVGHSMGGFLSIAFMLNHANVAADRLIGWLLMATFAGDVNRKNPQNRLQIPLIKSGILVKSVSIPAIGRAFTKSLVGEYVDGMAEAFVPIFTSHDHRALIPVMEAMTGENRYPRLGEIGIPTTVLVGTADHTTPPFHTDDLHAGIAGSKLVRLDGKGHALNWEAPDVVAAEVALLSGARAPS